MWILIWCGEVPFFKLIKRKAFQSHVYGIVRDMKQFVGKKEMFRQKKGFFFWGLSGIRSSIFFPEICYEVLGSNWKDSKAMKIQATQITAILTTESCVTSIIKIMHRDLAFIFLVLSVAVGVFSVAPSYRQASVYLLLMSHVDASWMFVGKPQNDFLFSAC